MFAKHRQASHWDRGKHACPLTAFGLENPAPQRSDPPAAARRQLWEQARHAAIGAFRDEHRAETLLNQARVWRQSQELADYLEALQAHLSSLPSDQRAAATEWLNWARAYARKRNPLSQRLQMPPDPEITPQALAPFMPGWSPYGPATTH